MSGLRFTACCMGVCAAQKAVLPLFMGIIAASRDVRDHKNVNIQAVLMDQEISPFGRWGSFVLELENIP